MPLQAFTILTALTVALLGVLAYLSRKSSSTKSGSSSSSSSLSGSGSNNNSGGASVLSPTTPREFPLIQKTVLSHNSAVYRFSLPRPNDTLGLPIGQHVSVLATINGKHIRRSYTPTSSDDVDKGYFDLLIKTYPTGNISKLIGNLPIGSSIFVLGPKGNFVYTPNLVSTLNMIAGGTGITPMYQIITAIARNPLDKTKINLIYANVNEEDILLKPELDALAAAATRPNQINIYYVLNNPPPEGWTGGVGFVTPEIIQANCTPPPPTNDDENSSLDFSKSVKLLVCGPPPMVSAIKKAAVDLGYEKPRPVSKLDDQVFVF